MGPKAPTAMLLCSRRLMNGQRNEHSKKILRDARSQSSQEISPYVNSGSRTCLYQKCERYFESSPLVKIFYKGLEILPPPCVN